MSMRLDDFLSQQESKPVRLDEFLSEDKKPVRLDEFLSEPQKPVRLDEFLSDNGNANQSPLLPQSNYDISSSNATPNTPLTKIPVEDTRPLAVKIFGVATPEEYNQFNQELQANPLYGFNEAVKQFAGFPVGLLYAKPIVEESLIGIAKQAPEFATWAMNNRKFFLPALMRTLEGGMAGVATKSPSTPVEQAATEGALNNLVFNAVLDIVPAGLKALLLKGKTTPSVEPPTLKPTLLENGQRPTIIEGETVNTEPPKPPETVPEVSTPHKVVAIDADTGKPIIKMNPSEQGTQPGRLSQPIPPVPATTTVQQPISVPNVQPEKPINVEPIKEQPKTPEQEIMSADMPNSIDEYEKLLSKIKDLPEADYSEEFHNKIDEIFKRGDELQAQEGLDKYAEQENKSIEKQTSNIQEGIGQIGGINIEKLKDYGYLPEEINRLPKWAKGSLSPDEAAQDLANIGYLSKPNVDDLMSALKNESEPLLRIKPTTSTQEIKSFIDEPMIENVKADYKYNSPVEKDKLTKGVNQFIESYAKYTKENPIIGKYGHKIAFYPHENAVKRLGEQKSFMEYALHSLTSEYGKGRDYRRYDNSKMIHLPYIEELIKNPDGARKIGNKRYYYKRINDKKHNYIVLHLHKEGNINIVDEPLRFVTHLPGRKGVLLEGEDASREILASQDRTLDELARATLPGSSDSIITEKPSDVNDNIPKDLTPEQENTLKKEYKRLTGSDDITFVKNIYINGKLAKDGTLGKFQNGLTEILKGQGLTESAKSTYHESGHFILHEAATPEERQYIMELAAKKFNSPSPRKIEEDFCETFARYAATKKGVFGKLKTIFDAIIARLKSFFGIKHNELKRIYDEMFSGLYRNKRQGMNTQEEPAREPLYREKDYKSEIEKRLSRLEKAREKKAQVENIKKFIIKNKVTSGEYKKVKSELGISNARNATKEQAKTIIDKLTELTKEKENRNLTMEYVKKQTLNKQPIPNEIIQKYPEIVNQAKDRLILDIAEQKGLIYKTDDGKLHNKLQGLIKYYKDATPDEIVDYISALSGTPKEPSRILKLYGDIKKDAEAIKIINEVNPTWIDINKLESHSLEPSRIIEKVTGKGLWENNILADNVFNVISGADEAMFDRLSQEINDLQANKEGIKKESKEDKAMMYKYENEEPLTEKEQKVINYLRGKFDSLISEANEMRGRLGYKPIPYRKNYITHIIEQNLLTEFFNGNQDRMRNISDDQLDAIRKGDYTKGDMPFNKFAQRRRGNYTKLGAIANYEIYLKTILKEIYYTPAIKHARKFNEYAVRRQPNAYQAIDRLLNDLKGKPEQESKNLLGAIANYKPLVWIRGRLSKNALLGNLNFWAMNASNFSTSAGELGTYLIKGSSKFLGSTKWRDFAFKHSVVLKGRSIDPDIDIGVLNTAEKWAGYMNNLIEYHNVGSTWLGAYFKGIKKMGLSEKQAFIYADSIARRTQAGYKKYEMNSYMRSNFGKLFSQFQTWSFNAMNHILYDMKLKNAGAYIGNKFRTAENQKPTDVRWGGLTMLIATSIVINQIYKALKLRQPYEPGAAMPNIPYLSNKLEVGSGKYSEPAVFKFLGDINTIATSDKPETKKKATIRAITSIGLPFGGTQAGRLLNGQLFSSPNERKSNIPEDVKKIRKQNADIRRKARQSIEEKPWYAK